MLASGISWHNKVQVIPNTAANISNSGRNKAMPKDLMTCFEVAFTSTKHLAPGNVAVPIVSRC